MSFISILRLTVLCLSLLFGVVVIGLDARWAWGSIVLDNFEIVAFLAGASTLVTVPTLLTVAATRKNAFTSMIAVELPVLGALWILWLISGALAADITSGCVDESDAVCRQLMAIEALSFLNWLLLMIYSITLLTFTLIAQSRGNNVWRLNANQAVFFPPKDSPAMTGQQGIVTGTPMTVTPQYQYPPGSVPMQQAVTPQINANPNPQPTPISYASYPEV